MVYINPDPKKKVPYIYILYTHLICHSCPPFEMVQAEFIILILEMRKLETREGKSLFQGPQSGTQVCLLLRCKATLPASHLNKKLSDCSNIPPFGFNSYCDDFLSGKACFLIAQMHPENPTLQVCHIPSELGPEWSRAHIPISNQNTQK